MLQLSFRGEQPRSLIGFPLCWHTKGDFRVLTCGGVELGRLSAHLLEQIVDTPLEIAIDWDDVAKTGVP